ncbi:aspartate kinase [Clostridiales bacterium PH28_bin88]|nr:aspartate kinase [Clostridiales bacterium PH28_bin88]
MRVLVQKFGGTSVASPELRYQVAQKVNAAVHQGYAVVVVVSAIGRAGAPYATDTLIELAKETNPDLSTREMDLIMACGEIISGTLMVGVLQSIGCPAVLLTGSQAGIITDGQFGDARIIRVESKRIYECLNEGKVVVVTGFQGVTDSGDITTLGRGGSDTTAAALGVALDAKAIEIYTDVDGVKTADPRIVADAKTLETISYNEVCQLAQEGAKVIHPRAVEIAQQKNIPLWVKNTFSDAPGTLVTIMGELNGVTVLNDRMITGITHIPNVTQLKIMITKEDLNDLPLKIFKALALAGISIDFINVHPEAIIFTVKDEIAPKALEVLENMGVSPQVRSGCAKIAAVGAGMTGRPGVMARIVEALTREGIQVLQSTDSYTSIWCLVAREDMEKAVRSLHRQFGLGA